MADEKCIATQGNNNKKAMIKAAIVFEDIKRKRRLKEITWLIPPHNEDTSDNILDYIDQRYDIKKIKEIHVLGDGANWIKSISRDIKFGDTISTFSLDKFHFMQAITRISKD